MTRTTKAANSLADKDLLSIGRLSSDQILALFDTAAQLKRQPALFSHALAGDAVMLLFEKPSLRTRVSFEVGVAKLGGTAVYMDHAGGRIGQRESIADYARNLERWTQAIVARTYSHATIEELARHAAIPVINGLSDVEHPCQALADFFTLHERFGATEGLKIAYIGDGNNVCHSLMLAAAKLGANFLVITPLGYEPLPSVVTEAMSIARHTGAEITITDEIESVWGRQIVYTDTWVSMGQDAESEKRNQAFAAFQVNEGVMEMASAGNGASCFMHCLPAHRGAEVTDAVIDSPTSLVYDQAENRMHIQNAILLHTLAPEAIHAADAPARNVVTLPPAMPRIGA